MIGVATVNVGTPALLAATDDGQRVYSGIAKRPVPPGTVLWLSLVNLSGDGQADLSVHGGPDKAVYAYPSEHLPAWEADLGEALGDAPFGENVSTVGALEADLARGSISISAPMARALIGKEEGDEAEIVTPGGPKRRFEIVRVEYK